MAPPANIQSVALQLEKVRKNVPTAYEQEHIWLDLIDAKADVLDASSRNIRLPQLIRPGGKFSVGTADFDDMGRGSGSTWEVGTLSTLQCRFAFEVSKLAEYATKGNDRAVEEVAVREVAEAMKMFKRALDCLAWTDGTGQLDTITSITSSTVFGVNNPNLFQFGQDIQVYPAGKTVASRGLATVIAVDPLAKTITVNAAPAGSTTGDALVVNISQGAGGANPVAIEGLLYHHVDSTTGSWNNIARSTYPEALKTPHVAAGGATITPALRRLGEFKLKRVLGVKFNEPMFALMNVDQLAAWENVGLTVTTNIMQQIDGDSTPDMLKKNPPKTFGGIPIEDSIHATLQRIDVVLPKHWVRGVTKEVGFYEEGGNTVFPIYGQSGGIVAGYISYIDTVWNMSIDQPRFGFFFDGLASLSGLGY